MPPPSELRWSLRKNDEEESAACPGKRKAPRQSLSQFPARFQSRLERLRSRVPPRAESRPARPLHAPPSEIQKIRCPNPRHALTVARRFPLAVQSLF